MRSTRSLSRCLWPGLLAALVLLAASCAEPSSSNPGASSPATTTDEQATPGRASEQSIEFDGRERTWTVYVPESVAGSDRPVPLVLAFHGTGDTGAGLRSGIGPDLEARAESDGVVIAYPDGVENNWNECRRAGEWPAKEEQVDDTGFARAIVERLDADLGPTGIDRDQVGALGFSSGGHMVMRLGLEAPDLVNAIAPVAANPPVADNQACQPRGEAVSTLFIQGTEDPINPFGGGEVTVGGTNGSRGEVLSAVDGARSFAARNHGGTPPTPEVTSEKGVEITTWAGDEPVRLVAVRGSKHSFPTASGRWGNTGGATYDAPGAIMDFFAAN